VRERERERERERDRANEPLTKRTHSQTLQILLFRRGALPEMVQRKRAFLRRERVSRAELRRGHDGGDDDDDDECGRENENENDVNDDDFLVPWWWCGGVYSSRRRDTFYLVRTDRQTDRQTNRQTDRQTLVDNRRCLFFF